MQYAEHSQLALIRLILQHVGIMSIALRRLSRRIPIFHFHFEENSLEFKLFSPLLENLEFVLRFNKDPRGKLSCLGSTFASLKRGIFQNFNF